VFYIVLFSVLAVLLVVAGLTAMSRNRKELSDERRSEHPKDAARRQRKAQRTQSRNARRKRH
jgi:Tfp pilus assembly protein PilX